MPLNIANPATVDLLLARRSVKTRDLTDPGPDAQALDAILKAGMRVPDHGKLTPWRFFVFQGDARATFGRAIADCYQAEEASASAATVKGLAGYPEQAPVLVVVASTPRPDKPIPAWEQHLSAGAACMSMLIAAHAQGYAGQWLTGWPAYSPGVKRWLELGEGDALAGFLFFGSATGEPTERPRPAFDDIVRWQS